jgi:hypothetical protein
MNGVALSDSRIPHGPGVCFVSLMIVPFCYCHKYTKKDSKKKTDFNKQITKKLFIFCFYFFIYLARMRSLASRCVPLAAEFTLIPRARPDTPPSPWRIPWPQKPKGAGSLKNPAPYVLVVLCAKAWPLWP